jgi:hypothetical protein
MISAEGIKRIAQAANDLFEELDTVHDFTAITAERLTIAAMPGLVKAATS